MNQINCYDINRLLLDIGNEDNPPYQVWSEEFNILVNNLSKDFCGLQKGHFNSAINTLAETLIELYDKTDIIALQKDSVSYEHVEKFSDILKTVCDRKNIKPTTSRLIVYSIKRILKQTPINKEFIKKVNINASIPKYEPNDVRNVLGSKYKKMELNNFVLQTLIGWVIKISKNSNIKSIVSLKSMMYSITSILEKSGVSIDNEGIGELKIETLKKYIKSKRHIYYLKTFFKCVFNRDVSEELNQLHDREEESGFFFQSKEDVKYDHDIHRFSVKEMELMYNEAKKTPRTDLMFLLLCTTGMRIGGLTNIRVSDVSTIEDGKILIKNTGRTLEKNRKWLTFTIASIVKPKLWAWILYHRKFYLKNDFLFPGTRGKLSQSVVRAILKNTAANAGVKGSHVHPHSFRHTFAHMLLECGNSIENISRLLGHSSSSTTEQFYLKESAAEVSKRSVIPWLPTPEKQKVVPDFLKDNGTKKVLSNEEKKLKHQRRKAFSKAIKNVGSVLETIEE